MRRAQVEMIGLLIIVFLLIVVGFFFLQLSKPKESNVEAGKESVRVNSLLNAMKKFTVCEGYSLNDVLANCENGDAAVCGASSSCGLAKDTVKNISDALLVTYNYKFVVDELANFEVSSGRCVEGVDKISSAESFLSVGGGKKLTLSYSFCKRAADSSSK
ncbi:hypothetical protein HY643_05400 [Candidatus Woesearchaeota archaeon]|nr:hypothetical protein [Candidatus Woesearchaeota archaeon]